jgi:prepilin-type N-terminal cleavage/methylation domain-containing protein
MRGLSRVVSSSLGHQRRNNGAAAFHTRGGFSLVEIMVAVLILSVLTMLAVPALAKVRMKARSAAIANDFRVFATAFQSYSQEHGTFPAEAAVGVIPTGMESSLQASAWTRTTPTGGKYNWENNQLHAGTRYKAAIAITDTADAPLVLDTNLLLELDRAIDDGDLNTGNFRLGMNFCPLFIIEQ